MELQEKELLEAVANTTTDEPVLITVDIVPTSALHAFLQKKKLLPKQRTFQLSAIKMGSLIRISKLLLEIDVSVFDFSNIMESNYKAIVQHSERLAECVAIALQNGRVAPSKKLTAFILRNFSTKEMLGVLAIVVKQMDLTSFMSSIISVKGMNILENRIVSAENVNLPEVSPSNQGS